MSLLPVGFGSSGDVDYTIDDSLRFRSSASAYLSRTPASAGNRRTWTWSGWVKRGNLSNGYALIATTSSSTPRTFFVYDVDSLWLLDQPSGTNANLRSTAKFRDPSAWYHVVLSVDTTQATSTNRVKMYVNGVEQVISGTYPTQNTDMEINKNVTHTIGSYSTNYFDGYLTEVNFIDGQALTADDFGEYDANGTWKAKKYTGTYGTNGFYIDTTTSGSTVLDQSGNSNNWTANNMNLTTSSATTYDLMKDTPSLVDEDAGNFCTWNPLYRNSGKASSIYAYSTYSNGNLTVSVPTNSYATSTMKMTSGKVYAETNLDTVTAESRWGFIWAEEFSATSITLGSTKKWGGFYHSYAPADILWYDEGTQQATTAITLANNDTLQWALDIDNGKAWLGVNNTWYDSSGGTTGNPSTGSNPTFTLTADEASNLRMFVGNGSSTSVYSTNFGQRPFAYTPPTGFKKLNTFNLPDSTIEKGSDYFNPVLYTGNGSTQSVSGVGFQPDWTWIKNRASAYSHQLYDVVRGATQKLSSDSSNAETTRSNALTSFDSDGFTTGSELNTNENGSAIVSWNWLANGSGVSNTDGSITSTVSANTTAGFSIVSYTGSPADTVGHGLGVAPQVIIQKDRDHSVYWRVFHYLMSGVEDYNPTDNLHLNATNAYPPGIGAATRINGVNATTFTNTGGFTSSDQIAYCFAPVKGYSAFGSYTGNGSTDGTFVYTGFRPAFLLMKRTDSTSSWYINDSIRSLDNDTTGEDLYPNLSNAEGGTVPIDILSNGFKLRNSNNSRNANGGTYIYMAFAENPFKNSLAR